MSTFNQSKEDSQIQMGLYPHERFAQWLECAPNIMSIDAGFEMMLTSTTVFLLVF